MQLDLDFAICAFSDYDDDGHAQIQTDSPGLDGNEGTEPAETLMPAGFYARPLDPDKGGEGEVGLGAPCLVLTAGDHRYAIPLGDPRDVGKIPKLRKGGRMMAGGAGDYRSFLMIDGEDPAGAKAPGSITISASYTKSGAKKSLGFSFNVRDAGTEDISIFHGNGQRATLAQNGVTITSANGESYVEVSNDGNVLAGDSKVQGSLTVGEQLAGMPVVLGPPLVAFLTKLIAVLVPIVGVSGAGAPAAALAADFKTLLSNHLKAT